MPSLILEDDVQGVNDAWNVAEDGKGYIDQEISATSFLHQNTNGG